jgi:hypothetical protein
MFEKGEIFRNIFVIDMSASLNWFPYIHLLGISGDEKGNTGSCQSNLVSNSTFLD